MRLVLILVSILLSACGQRGPLYLPEEPQPEAVLETEETTEQADEDPEAEERDQRAGGGEG